MDIIKVKHDYSSEKRGIQKPSFRTGAHAKGLRREKTRSAKLRKAISYERDY